MRKILTILKGGIQSLLIAMCPHTRLTRPFRDEDGDYQRCLKCGSRIQCLMWFGDSRPLWKQPSPAARGRRRLFEVPRGDKTP